MRNLNTDYQFCTINTAIHPIDLSFLVETPLSLEYKMLTIKGMPILDVTKPLLSKFGAEIKVM